MKQLSANRCFGGQQLRFQHSASSLNCDMNFSIYLPPQAEQSSVPVLFWLSGLTCTDENFVHKAGAQRYAAQYGVAIVSPDTSPRGETVPDDPNGAWDFGLGAGFYLNATRQPWSQHYRMYDYVVEELTERVAEKFPVDMSRQGIFGHSMGGHGALTIGLKNPGRFQSVSAFSPICAPMHCPWGRKAFTEYLGDNPESWREYDACELLSQANQRVPILIDQGGDDAFLEEQLLPGKLVQACENTQYPLQMRTQPGYDHSYFFIASFIGEHVKFHAENAGKAMAE